MKVGFRYIERQFAASFLFEAGFLACLLLGVRTPVLAQAFPGFCETHPLSWWCRVTPTATPTVLPTLPPVTPTPEDTPVPITPEPILPPVEMNNRPPYDLPVDVPNPTDPKCGRLKILVGLAAAQDPTELAMHAESWKRSIKDCEEYFRDTKPGEAPLPWGSVMDLMNSKLGKQQEVHKRLEATLKTWGNSVEEIQQNAKVLTGDGPDALIKKHKYELGNPEFLDDMFEDFGTISNTDTFFDCLKYKLRGICWDWKLHFVLFVPTYLEFWLSVIREYNWPVMTAEASEFQALTRFLPRDLVGLNMAEMSLGMGRMVLEGRFNIFDGITDSLNVDAVGMAKHNQVAISKAAIQGAYAFPGKELHLNQPGPHSPGLPNDAAVDQAYNEIKRQIDLLPGLKEAKHSTRSASEGTINNQYHIQRSWWDVFITPLWNQISLGSYDVFMAVPIPFTSLFFPAVIHVSLHIGGCHAGRGCAAVGALAPYWSEGSLYAPLSVPLANDNFAAAIPPFTENMLWKLAGPYFCTLSSMKEGSARFGTPYDLIHPGMLLLPMPPRTVTKDCTYQMQNVFGLFQESTMRTRRPASVLALLRGLKSTLVSSALPQIPLTPYGTIYPYQDQPRDADDKDRIQALTDDVFKDKIRELYGSNTCVTFGTKGFPYSGEYEYGIPYSRDYQLADSDQMPWSQSETDMKRGRVAMHNSIAVWKKFRCCWPYYKKQLCPGCGPPTLIEQKPKNERNACTI